MGANQQMRWSPRGAHLMLNPSSPRFGGFCRFPPDLAWRIGGKSGDFGVARYV